METEKELLAMENKNMAKYLTEVLGYTEQNISDICTGNFNINLKEY